MHPTPDFPVSVPAMIVWAVLLSVVITAFVASLLYLNRKGHRRIIGLLFVLLLLAGTAVHMVLLADSHHTVTEGNWIQLALVSLVAALEMFIGHTVVFDDIIAAVIFHEPGLMIAYISVFLLVVSFTLSIALLIMPRRLRDRLWLLYNSSKAKLDKKYHIFLGITPLSKMLVKTLLTGEKAPADSNSVLLVEFPEKQGHKAELSIGELVTNIFGRRRELSLEEELGSDHFTLLRGHSPNFDSGPLCKAIGLDRLHAWLMNPRSNVYLLSQDEDEDFTLLRRLVADPSVKAKIFCYSSSKNSYVSLFAAQKHRVNLLNPQELSFSELKQHHPELLPVHYAALARNKEGRPFGYAEKGITALLLGFGGCGQEALRFLYEYGSFVGQDLEAIPNTYHVYDPDIEARKGDFLSRTPAMRYDASLDWSSAPVGSSRFWLEYAMMLPSLNYVVISLDEGHQNVEIAIRLLQEAVRYGKDLSRLCILALGWESDRDMADMVDFYNRSYCPKGQEVIHLFGEPESIWNLEIITGKRLKKQAVAYYEKATRLLGVTDESWEERRKRLLSQDREPLRNHQELMRKQAVEMGSCLFASTLLTLSDPTLRDKVDGIPVRLDAEHPDHYPSKDPVYRHFEYLAAGEHLHWMTALQAAGYIDGAGQQDELNKKIKNLLPYSLLPDEDARHLPWLAVKLALMADPQPENLPEDGRK